MMARTDSGLKPGRMKIALDGAGGEVNPVLRGATIGGRCDGSRPPSGGRSGAAGSDRQHRAHVGASALHGDDAPSRGGARARPGVPPGGAAQAGRDFLRGGRQGSEWRVDPRPACRGSDREQVA